VATTGMKTCGMCKIEKLYLCFGRSSHRVDGYRWECKECRRLIVIRDKAKKLAYDEKYRNDNREAIRERNRNYGMANRKKLNVQNNVYRRKGREALSDDYIKQALNGESNFKFKLGEIPQEMIEAKRLQLMIWRMTHENSNNT